MSKFELLYLCGSIAAFGLFAITLAFARATSHSRP